MRETIRRAAWNATVCSALVCSALVGCSRNDRPQLVNVEVLVTFNGQPLEQGAIRFESADDRPAVGNIVRGRVPEMTTFGSGDGVPVGSHRVAVESFAPTDNPMGELPESLIPLKYANTRTSGLTAEVVPDGPNTFRFELTD